MPLARQPTLPDRLAARMVPLGSGELTDPWEALVRSDPLATVFATPLFQRALFAAFGPPRAEAVVLDRGGQIAGLMPVTPLPLRRGPLVLREAGFFRGAHTLRNTLLIPPGPDPARLLLERLTRHFQADTLLFQNLPAAGAMPADLAAAAASLGLAADPPRAGRVLMWADIAEGYEAYLATRSGQFRRHVRKMQRTLAEAGDLAVDRLTGDAILAAMDDWQAVVSASWQGQDPRAVGDTAEDWGFHRALAGNGALFLMRLKGRPVACLRLLEHRDVAYVHTMNFDRALRDKAPGLVLFDHMMRDSAERAFRRVDFNGNSDFYARWATGETPHVTLRFYATTLRGRLARTLRRITVGGG